MSTGRKRPWRAAHDEAEAFRALFPQSCYMRWQLGGSIRRQREQVGDVDHVIIPAVAHRERQGSLFAEPERVAVDLLWEHLDGLVAGGLCKLAQYVRSDGSTFTRWGDTARGVEFKGFKHELWTCVPESWGAQLAIRTGPPKFSQRLASLIKRTGHRNKDGYVWRCEPCPNCVEGHRDNLCRLCDGYQLHPVQKVSVPDESDYLRICGVPWVAPERRDDWQQQ